MIVVELVGGLGNQLFQYAFGQALAKKLNEEVAYDTRSLLRRGKGAAGIPRDLHLQEVSLSPRVAGREELKYWPQSRPGLGRMNQLASEAVWRLFIRRNHPLVIEKYFHYDADAAKGLNSAYYRGYWQSTLYFETIADALRARMQPRAPMSSETTELLHEIQSSSSVCVNVRRGDFANHPASRKFHGLMEAEYYKTAVADLMARNACDEVFVFSDEPDWCMAELTLGVRSRVIGHEHAGPGFSHYLFLMAAAAHFVIPNSTFAWWAVWLRNPPPQNVVAPANWFAVRDIDTRDLIPAGWSRI